jgi:CheY-like chemotaxis protein
MPATIVVVHDDPTFVDRTVTALRAAGHTVMSFADPMAALAALEAVEHLELLLTRVQFSPGQPNGVALARMVRFRLPRSKVLFVALPERREHTEGVGELLPTPVTAAEILAAVDRLLTRDG